MPNYVQSLESELNAKDISSAAKSAHAIKGVAGNLSTLALADLAKHLERACLDEKPVAEIVTLQERLMPLFDLTCHELSAWLNENS